MRISLRRRTTAAMTMANRLNTEMYSYRLPHGNREADRPRSTTDAR